MKWKFLSAVAFAALSAKAEKLEALEAAFKATAPEGTEMTADSIIEMLASAKVDTEQSQQLQDLQAKLEAAQQASTDLQTKLTASEQQVSELTTQVDNLKKGAGAQGAAAQSNQETTAGEGDSVIAALDGKSGANLLATMRNEGLV